MHLWTPGVRAILDGEVGSLESEGAGTPPSGIDKNH